MTGLGLPVGWPPGPGELAALQRQLAEEAARLGPVALPSPVVFGGCFVAWATGEAGPGHAGDRGWADAVAWQPTAGGSGGARPTGQVLAGARQWPRQASDVLAQTVVQGRAPAPYARGLLALREGPLLEAAVSGLRPRPSLLLVDATGRDHPRRGGLALHLGAVLGLPTVGVTHRPLVAQGPLPRAWARGARAPLWLGDEVVAYWACTRTGARPVVAHAGWGTSAAQAADLVLLASTGAARSPVPLQEARRVAREARWLAERGGPLA